MKPRRTTGSKGPGRYLGVLVVLAIWLVGVLTDFVGNLIHLLLPVALIMTLFIYFAGRYSESR